MKYLRFTTSGCGDMGIKKSEIVTKLRFCFGIYWKTPRSILKSSFWKPSFVHLYSFPPFVHLYSFPPFVHTFTVFLLLYTFTVFLLLYTPLQFSSFFCSDGLAEKYTNRHSSFTCLFWYEDTILKKRERRDII